MTAWVIRGGRNGEREEDALETSVVTIGYETVRDLSGKRSEPDIKARVRDDNSEDWSRVTNNQIALWTGNVWKFIGLINTGDLVVMPLKGKGTIAVGEIAGEYEYRLGVREDLVHSRGVRWLHKEFPINTLDLDLQRSLTVQQTVYQPKSENAEQRLRRSVGPKRGLRDGNEEESMNAWVVRSGARGEDYSNSFWGASVVAIGFAEVDLSGISTREEMKNKLRLEYPHWNEGQLGNFNGQLYRFAKEIQEGDLILTPPAGQDELLIGRCQGPYEHSATIVAEDMPHVRKVNWIKKTLKSNLSVRVPAINFIRNGCMEC